MYKCMDGWMDECNVSPATWRDGATAFLQPFWAFRGWWGEKIQPLSVPKITYFLPEIVGLGFHRAQDPL